MNTPLAPILLFVYNRPEHTTQLINSLINCEMSDSSELFVFIDAPKKDANKIDIQKNEAVIKIINNIKHFKKITIYKNEINKGVDKSIMDGVTKIINLYGKVIVLEDDLIVAIFFLKYMNWALNTYELNKRIYSVNGFMFPVETLKKGIVLLPYIRPWGWATWKDRWQTFSFDEDNRTIISECTELKQLFDVPSCEFPEMLINEKECWDINWYFYVFKHNGLNVFPTQTLVKNNGFDGTGVHCPNSPLLQNFNPNIQLSLTEESTLDLVFYKSYFEYFKNTENNRKHKLKIWAQKIIFNTLKKLDLIYKPE